MSVPLTINGAIFNYPVNFDTNWGIDATGWAQAVTSGMLQKAGGSFPLTADVDFGASFGLKVAYLTSHAANPATSGTVRLSSADPGVVFRNNANSGNLVLTTDASDNLVWGSSFLLQNTNSLKLQDTGNVHTISLHSPSVTANYSLVLPPNAGSNGQVLSTDGTGTTTWVNAAGTGTVNSATAGQLAYYATSSNVVDGLAALSYSAPILTFTAGAANTLLNIVSSGINTSTIQLGGNGLTNSLNTDSNGTFDITDINNSRNFFMYNRSGGGLVTLATPLAMGSNKITGLAAPTTTNDALAYGHGFDVGGNKITGLVAPTSTGDALSQGNAISGTTGTFTGAVDVGSNKITNVAAGTTTFDAANFSQIRTFNTIQGISTTAFSTTTNTFNGTNSVVSITPSSSSHRIKITASASISILANNQEMFITIARNGTNIGPSQGFTAALSSAGTLESPISLVYIDSPATTSLTTYSIQIRNADNVTTVQYGKSSQNQVIIVEEIA
jgi:hypothetical protein